MGNKFTIPEKNEHFGETEYEQLKKLYEKSFGKWDKEAAEAALNDTLKGSISGPIGGMALMYIGLAALICSLALMFFSGFLGIVMFMGSIFLIGYSGYLSQQAYKRRSIAKAMKQYMAVDPALTEENSG